MNDAAIRLPDGNVFADAAPPATGERFDPLRRVGPLLIERIISSATPEPGEYVQTQDEWVLLMQGAATLLIDGQAVTLAAGDYLFLPAGTPHTVARTAPGTLWLALHLDRSDRGAG